jgi:pSer/pThr/pTyr-binding forkhead associated (FHA) protein
MAIELRIVSGARAGQEAVFDRDVIRIGRDTASDIRFDPERDLDVSANHAEVHRRGDGWVLIDRASTNGSFVNGERVAGERLLRDGDVIRLGPREPAVRVRNGARAPRPISATEERIAVAVRKETRGLRTGLAAAVVLLGAIAVGSYLYGSRRGDERVAERAGMLAQYESLTVALRARTDPIGDTALTGSLQRQLDSLRSLVRASGGSDAAATSTREELRRSIVAQQGLVSIDAAGIARRNEPAVTMLLVQLGDTLYEATAFSIASEGLLVTNRHNVVLENGTRATSIEVRFANTSTTHTARVLSMSEDEQTDLALLQIEARGPFPAVAGVRANADVDQGASLVTIGFPLGRDIPLDGTTLRTSLFMGTLSRRGAGSLEIDAYARPGSSGSPVFDGDGFVVGVVRGGLRGTDGRVLQAVSSDRLVPLLPERARGIVR